MKLVGMVGRCRAGGGEIGLGSTLLLGGGSFIGLGIEDLIARRVGDWPWLVEVDARVC